MFTRRFVNTGLMSLGALAKGGAWSVAVAQTSGESDFARRLQAELDAAVKPGCSDTRLTLAGFSLVQTASGSRTTFRMDALVRLDWPPGMRQRPFLFYAPDPEQAYGGVRDRILDEFGRTYPTCITVA